MPDRPTFHPTRRSFLAASGLGTAALLAPALWTSACAAFVANPWARADAIVARITVPTFPARDFYDILGREAAVVPRRARRPDAVATQRQRRVVL